jgi:Protein of unknown function (DUF3540)
MTNAAKSLDATTMFQDIGTVTHAELPRLMVKSTTGDLEATRAASCLLEPCVGDRVLVAGSRREGFYVLAILTREEGTRAAVSLDGDLEVRLRSGRFVVAAQEAIDLVSAGQVTVVSEGVAVHAAVGDLAIDRLTVVGALVRAEIDAIKLFARRVDSVVERVAQRVKRSYRTVEETDQVRAERIDYVAKKTAHLHGENALVTAKELVKIDGEQIHVG